MPQTLNIDFLAIIKALQRGHVDFIVVGGVAAVLHGAPINTFDLDIVHARFPENIDRLIGALGELGAHYRDQTGRKLPPAPLLLAGDGHNLFATTHGPLDVLGVIGTGHTYETLLPDTIEQSVGGFRLRVLALGPLIRVKEETARDKDRAVLAILRRTLEQSSK